MMACNNIMTQNHFACEPHPLSAAFCAKNVSRHAQSIFDSLTKYSYSGKRCLMQKRLVSYMLCMMYRLTTPATDDKPAYYSSGRYGCNEGHTVVCSVVSPPVCPV